MFSELIAASTLKPEIVEGLDIIILRELNGDAYYGEPRGITVSASGERERSIQFATRNRKSSASPTWPSAPARERHRKVCSVTRPMSWKSLSCGARW